METSRLPGLRPASGGMESLAAFFLTMTVEGLERAAAKSKEKHNQKSWMTEYSEALASYRRTGEGLLIEAGVTSITRGNRSRVGLRLSDYGTGLFTELDAPDVESATVQIRGAYSTLSRIEVTFTRWETTVEVEDSGWLSDHIGPAPTIEMIEQILTSTLKPWDYEPIAPVEQPNFRVFIGHGGDSQWKDLRDGLREHHGFEVEAFEALPRASQVISDILQGMAAASTAAVLILTKADEMKDGTWHGRQNVVHEIGFFQGRLGWDHAIIVVEQGVVLPSNLDGTQQVRFPEGVISAAEGQVVAALQALRNRPIGICP